MEERFFKVVCNVRLMARVFGSLAVVALIGGLMTWQDQSKNSAQGCTLEAKLCPDGSSVGRAGSECQFARCPERAANMGTLKGEITVGPMCPNEPCSVNPSQGRQLQIVGSDGKSRVVLLPNDGTFLIYAAEGSYQVSMVDCTYVGCSRVFPKKVTIRAGQTVEMNVNVDTGIR